MHTLTENSPDDSDPPIVIGGSILREREDYLQIGEKITILFNEEIKESTVNSNTVIIKYSPDKIIKGEFVLSFDDTIITSDNTKITFSPEVPLKWGEAITVELKGCTTEELQNCITDLVGNKYQPEDIPWILHIFEPIIIATINEKVSDMEILPAKNETPPYLMATYTTEEGDNLLAVDIKDAAQVDMENNQNKLFTWPSSVTYFFNNIKIAQDIGPIQNRSNEEFTGDFLFVTAKMEGYLAETYDSSHYHSKFYPGHTLLIVYNINDPLDPQSVNVHILSNTPTEERSVESYGGIYTSFFEMIGSMFGASGGLTGRSSGSFSFPRDTEYIGNNVFISNYSSSFEQDVDAIQGIQKKNISISDGNYADNPAPIINGNFVTNLRV